MKNALLIVFIFTMMSSYAQVGIGTTTPDNSAALEISSTTKMFLPPRMTETQMNAISNPAEGGVVFCTDCSPKGLYVYIGTFFISVNGTTINGFNFVTGSGGATWLDRNLGASRVATSLADSDAYGGYYQWGRTTDGHQISNSATSSGPVTSGNEGSNFIIPSSGSDWLSVQDDTRWNGSTKGTHDPCPEGFRVPTLAEWTTESSAWSSANSAGAFASPLKLTAGGSRNFFSGIIANASNTVLMWSSTASGTDANNLLAGSSSLSLNTTSRGQGLSVRCIQE